VKAVTNYTVQGVGDYSNIGNQLLQILHILSL